jgi:hypothetical protein
MIELFESREQRQHHERQIRIDDAEIDREGRAHDLQRVINDPEPKQRRIEEAVSRMMPSKA